MTALLLTDLSGKRNKAMQGHRGWNSSCSIKSLMKPSFKKTRNNCCTSGDQHSLFLVAFLLEDTLNNCPNNSVDHYKRSSALIIILVPSFSFRLKFDEICGTRQRFKPFSLKFAPKSELDRSQGFAILEHRCSGASFFDQALCHGDQNFIFAAV